MEQKKNIFFLLGCWWQDICLLTAIGLTPCGSSTVHMYTQTIHRTRKLIWEECGAFPVFANYTLAFALQLRKKLGKASVQHYTTPCPSVLTAAIILPLLRKLHIFHLFFLQHLGPQYWVAKSRGWCNKYLNIKCSLTSNVIKITGILICTYWLQKVPRSSWYNLQELLLWIQKILCWQLPSPLGWGQKGNPPKMESQYLISLKWQWSSTPVGCGQWFLGKKQCDKIGAFSWPCWS